MVQMHCVQVFDRLFEAAGCTTQQQLARFFTTGQAAVSDAVRRKHIPAQWLLHLVRIRGINPDWVLYGSGPKFICTEGAACGNPSRSLERFSTKALAAELARRLCGPDVL